MRVLHIVTHMNRGGLETMIMNYYRRIDRAKIQFDFLVHRQERADYDDEIAQLGGKIYRLPILNPWSLCYRRQLNTFFVDHSEYKIVHCHLDCMSAIPLEAAKKAGVLVRIAHGHSSSQDNDWKYLLKLYYKKRIPGAATQLFACGLAAGDWMFEGHNYEVMPNAIDASIYAYDESRREKAREKLGLGESLTIGHVGRFCYPKNHEFIIKVFAEVKKQEPEAKLMLVGSGEGMSTIQQLVKELDLQESVKFLGLRKDIPDLLQAMDVFLFPSRYEGLSVATVEAQAAGLPCIMSDQVPVDCKMTDHVEFVSLEESTVHWAEHILQMAQRERSDSSEAIKKAHFDIVENVKWLQEYYQNAVK